jgi:hypothetical protein
MPSKPTPPIKDIDYRNIRASDIISHRSSPQKLWEGMKNPMSTVIENKRIAEYLADIENEADATGREVEPSVRSFLRRLFEDNLGETFHHHKKGGQIKKKRKRSKKKPRGWGKARYV